MKRFCAFLLSFVLVLSVGSVGTALAAETQVGKGEYGVDWFYYGDVDGDRVVNAKDALAALKYAVSKQKFTPTQVVLANVNGDEIINAKDALDMLKYAVSKLSAFSVGVIYQLEPAVEELNTANSFNGAYEEDPTADTSFVMDNTGLEANTVYLLQSGCYKVKNADGTVNDLESYNMERLMVSLQGLINRDFGIDETHRTIIYSTGDTSDTDWLNNVLLKDGVFKDFKKVSVTNQDSFLEIFGTQIRHCGYVLWDKNVPATANVAATICGIDAYFPVFGGTQLETKLKSLNVAEKMSLVGKFKNNGTGKISGSNTNTSGSAKNDAYLWALEKYGNRCSSKYIAYTLDGAATIPDMKYNGKNFLNGQNCLDNHDYLIARRCFFFDLSPHTADVACDDPAGKAGLDAQTMRKIFQKRYDRARGEMGMNMGFPPWWCKYTKEYGGGVLTALALEPYFAELVTCYNLAMEADASPDSEMTNGSAYYKYVPLLSKFENSKPTTNMTYDNSKYYFTFYIGDYDSSAWMKRWVHSIWIKQGGDRKRGKVNMMWSFNPNLSYRVPMAFDYIYRNKSDKDFFAAGDSGAGYVNPTALFPNVTLSQSGQKRPTTTGDGSAKWISYCKEFYERFDLDITGFIINTGNSFDKKVMDMYNQISPIGSTYYNGNDNRLLLNNGVPYIQCRIGVGKNKSDYLYDWAMNNMKGYHFAAYRTVNWTPTEINSTAEGYISYAKGKGKTVEYVDPYNFFSLIRQSGQGVVVK